MWKCPKCGRENEILFCSECGTKKPEQTNTVNNISDQHQEFARVTTPKERPQPSFSGKKEKNNGLLYIIIGVLSLALIFSIFFVMKKSDNENEAPKEETEQISEIEDVSVEDESKDPEEEIRAFISENFNEPDISVSVFDFKTEKYYLGKNAGVRFEGWGFYLPVALAYGEYTGSTSDTFLNILSHDAGICNASANKAINEIGGLTSLNNMINSRFGCNQTNYGRKFGDIHSTSKNFTTAQEATMLLEKFYNKYGSYDLNYDTKHFGIEIPSNTVVHSQIGTENINVKNMLNFFGTVRGKNSDYIVVVLTKNKAGAGTNMTKILDGIHEIMEEASL